MRKSKIPPNRHNISEILHLHVWPLTSLCSHNTVHGGQECLLVLFVIWDSDRLLLDPSFNICEQACFKKGQACRSSLSCCLFPGLTWEQSGASSTSSVIHRILSPSQQCGHMIFQHAQIYSVSPAPSGCLPFFFVSNCNPTGELQHLSL